MADVGFDIVDADAVVLGCEAAGYGFSSDRMSTCEGTHEWGPPYMPRLEPVTIAALFPIVVLSSLPALKEAV